MPEAQHAPLLGTVAAMERLRAGRATPFRIEGISMEPLLHAGWKVLLEPCAPRDLRRGDLVAFERDGAVILHRVLAVDAKTGAVAEKGDNAPRPRRVEPCDVLGRAVALLEPREVSLAKGRLHALGPSVARLSALHGGVHRLDRFAARYPRARLDLLLRLFDGLLRAARRLILSR